jgi:hypothetical protein
MKTRLFIIFVLTLSLALLLTWSAAAQSPEPPAPPQRDGPPSRLPTGTTQDPSSTRPRRTEVWAGRRSARQRPARLAWLTAMQEPSG